MVCCLTSIQYIVFIYTLRNLPLAIFCIFSSLSVNGLCAWFAPVGNLFSFVWEKNTKNLHCQCKICHLGERERECSCRINLLHQKWRNKWNRVCRKNTGTENCLTHWYTVRQGKQKTALKKAWTSKTVLQTLYDTACASSGKQMSYFSEDNIIYVQKAEGVGSSRIGKPIQGLIFRCTMSIWI